VLINLENENEVICKKLLNFNYVSIDIFLN